MKKTRFIAILLAVIFALQTVSFAEGRCNITLKDVKTSSEENTLPEPIDENFESGELNARFTAKGNSTAMPAISYEKENSDNHMLVIPSKTAVEINEIWQDFVLETDLILTEYGWFQFNFRINNGDYLTAMVATNSAKAILSLRKVTDGKTSYISEKGNYTFGLNDKVNLKIVLHKNELEFYVNDSLFLSGLATGMERGSFSIGVPSWSAAAAKIDNLKIAPIAPKTIKNAYAIQRDITMKVGEKLWLPVYIEPQGVYDASVVSRCDDETVVYAYGGSVKALANGTANVRLVTNDGGHKTDFVITVISSEYDDIENSKYKKDIEYLSEKNILSDGNEKFEPEMKATVAEICSVAVKTIGYDLLRARDKNSPKVIGTDGYGYPSVGVYDDVGTNDWFAPYIRTAVAAKLIPAGTAAGKNITPDKYITRAELASFAVNTYKNASGAECDTAEESEASDISNLSNDKKTDILKAVKMEFIPVENGRFEPERTVTRAEMAHTFAEVHKRACETGLLPVVPLDIEIYGAREKTGIIVDITDFGGKAYNPETDKPEDRFDNYDAFVAALEYCKEVNADKLVFPTGYYYFSTEDFISMDDFTDFVIDGQNSVFVNSAAKHFVRARKCERVEIRNVEYEWDWDSKPLADIITVTKADAADKSIDIEYISRGYVKENEVSLADFCPLDPETLSPGYDNGVNNIQQRVSYNIDASKTKRLADNKFRVYLATGSFDERIKEGCFYRLQYYKYKGNFFVCYDIQDFTFDNVNICSTSGIGYTIYNLYENESSGKHTQYWQIINSKIDIRDGEELTKPVSSSQDGVQVNGQAKDSRYRIENCSFGYMGDDCSNLHQRISQGISFVEGDRYSIIAKKADWSTPIRGGDTIEILNNDFSVTGFAAAVKSAEYVDGIGIKLTFDKEIPQNLPESCIVSNKTIGQNTWGIIRNNRFHDNLGRGLLVRGDHILIENNTFEHTNSSATMTEVEITSGWVSGLPSSHLWFKGNKFINCNVSEKQEATMNFTHNLQGGYSAGTSLISRLLIEDNDFVNTTARGIVIDLFDDVTIRNNRFTGFKERPNSIKERGGLKITNGKHLKIYGNRFEKSPYIAGDVNSLLNITGVDDAVIYDNLLE